MPPTTPVHRASVTPGRLTWSAQSKASSRGSKKEDRSSLAPIFDAANMVSKKKKRRRRKYKHQRVDRTESEVIDRSGAEEVEVKQEVKKENLATSHAKFNNDQIKTEELGVKHEVKQENRPMILAALKDEKSGAQEVDVKREAPEENLATHHAELDMNLSEAETANVKQEVKHEDSFAESTAFNGETSETGEIRVKQEAQKLCFAPPVCSNTRLKPRATQGEKKEIKQEIPQKTKESNRSPKLPFPQDPPLIGPRLNSSRRREVD